MLRRGAWMGRDDAVRPTALVVDDNMLNRMLHGKLLDVLGVENRAVENGEEALRVHSTGETFDLILMDRDMPVMNGVEATKKLRAMGIKSRIVGVSSHPVGPEKEEFMEAGLDDYHEKPLTVAKLLPSVTYINKP